MVLCVPPVPASATYRSPSGPNLSPRGPSRPDAITNGAGSIACACDGTGAKLATADATITAADTDAMSFIACSPWLVFLGYPAPKCFNGPQLRVAIRYTPVKTSASRSVKRVVAVCIRGAMRAQRLPLRDGRTVPLGDTLSSRSSRRKCHADPLQAFRATRALAVRNREDRPQSPWSEESQAGQHPQ